jgi:flagellar biosynthesis GTPase FlhF
MELKRILARDTRSATEKAMAMFGPDVLIISNHRVEGQTELIVALDVADASLEELFESELEANSQESNSVTVTAISPRQRISSTPTSVSSPFNDH